MNRKHNENRQGKFFPGLNQGFDSLPWRDMGRQYQVLSRKTKAIQVIRADRIR